MSVRNAERRSRYMEDKIVKQVRYNDVQSPTMAYWALCLDDGRRNPREVHTCATSYCISILNEGLARCEKNDEKRIHTYQKLIGCAVRCLIQLRNANGTWQSFVQPVVLKKGKSTDDEQGEIAIGGTYYSIKALLDVGFLTRGFAYIDGLPDALQTLNGRIEYMLETVRWLLENRVSETEFGWYYTNAKDGVSVTDSTVKVFSILYRIFSSIKGDERFSAWYCELDRVLKATENLLVTNIKEDGGIDREIFSETSESGIAYTCKMVDALLLSNDPEYVDEVVRAVDFIVKNVERLWENGTLITRADIFGERYYITTQDGDEIPVFHEHFIEGTVLHTLLGVWQKTKESGSFLFGVRLEKARIKAAIEKCAEGLERLQTKRGENNGLFRSHLNLSEGCHPVYASFEGYRALRMYLEAAEQTRVEMEREAILNEEELNVLRCEIISHSPFVDGEPFLFVSYPHRDGNVVLEDVQQLKKICNCWVDFEHLDGGRCENEKDWTGKVLPVLNSPLCKGVIMYVSEAGFSSNGLLREAEWILQKRPQVYTILVGFSDTITPKEMAEKIEQITDENLQRKLRRKAVFSEIGQATADETEYAYYHRKADFSHLRTYDFQNWLERIFNERGKAL